LPAPSTRFVYTPFDKKEKKRKLTTNEKYREATRATEDLRSELADIADDKEFETYLNFVLDSWRRIRQRRLISDDKPSAVDDANNADSDDDRGVSQALSQPHSLYSEELGNVRLVAPVPVAVTGDLIVESQPDKAPNADSDVQIIDKPPRAALNPRAAKSGRPRLHKTQQRVGERENRMQFNAAQDTWKQTGSISLQDLADTLDKEQPTIEETAARLSNYKFVAWTAATRTPRGRSQSTPCRRTPF
jgi:hypothetical protein